MSQNITTALIAAVVSLLVASGGWYVNYWAQNRSLEVKMLEIAVGILRAEPSDNIRPAREWAVDVISRYSEVPLSEASRNALLQNRAIWGASYETFIRAIKGDPNNRDNQEKGSEPAITPNQ